MKIGVLLSGCGVYDGAEIQEAVFTLLAIEELGATYQGISINKEQHHVINHLTGETMNESRNMLIESARIVRGKVADVNDINSTELDILVIPGGFGSAKNFSSWAFEGPNGEVLPEISHLISEFIAQNKPIVALCISPVVIALTLKNKSEKVTLTLGSTKVTSPYTIQDFHDGIASIGAKAIEKTINEINIDTNYKIISTPCYMLDCTLPELRKNIYKAIEAAITIANNQPY
jgi:enhancing lycopene biosynthesis protein 2